MQAVISFFALGAIKNAPLPDISVPGKGGAVLSVEMQDLPAALHGVALQQIAVGECPGAGQLTVQKKPVASLSTSFSPGPQRWHTCRRPIVCPFVIRERMRRIFSSATSVRNFSGSMYPHITGQRTLPMEM